MSCCGSLFVNLGGGGGGTVNTGVLQIAGGVALDSTLRFVEDQNGTDSPLQLSTNAVTISSSLSGNVSLIFENTNAGGFGQLWNAGGGLSTYTLQWRGFDTTGAGGRIYPEGMFIGAQSVPSARLHVRGDATNPIARFENSAGTNGFTILNAGNVLSSILYTNTGIQYNNEGIDFYGNVGVTASSGAYRFYGRNSTFVAGTSKFLDLGFGGPLGYSPTSGNGIMNFIDLRYTINATGTTSGAVVNGIFLNATETSLTGTTHNLMDLQTGGSSRFSVANNGTATSAGAMNATSFSISGGGSYSISIGGGNGGRIYGATNGFTFTNLNLTGALFLQLGGTTNAFPAIKKNASSAAIDFRLADDTGYSNITLGRILAFGSGASTIRWYTNMDFNQFSFGLTWYNSANSAVIEFSQNGDTIQLGSGLFGSVNSTPAASAIIEGRSTTKGFLPPRMTTTNRDNIVSPATGLQLYNTSTNNTDTFDGTNWQSFGKETKITGSLEVNIASGKVINAIEVSSAMGLGFYNAAAIIQPVTGGASATYANVSGTEIKENDTFDGYTIGNVVKALRDLGLLA
jgi:hypothetical protein